LTTILVIDDDEMIRQVLRRVLVLHGYGVHEAADGEEGLEKIGKLAPDLVVTDVSMPKKDGLSVIRELRSLGNGRPIVALAKLGDKTLEDALNLGADRVVGKPFRLKTFLKVVEEVLERGAG